MRPHVNAAITLAWAPGFTHLRAIVSGCQEQQEPAQHQLCSVHIWGLICNQEGWKLSFFLFLNESLDSAEAEGLPGRERCAVR